LLLFQIQFISIFGDDLNGIEGIEDLGGVGNLDGFGGAEAMKNNRLIVSTLLWYKQICVSR